MFDSIAVGVDGSQASLAALHWTLKTATLHGAAVTAVIATPVANRPGITAVAAKLASTMTNEHVQDVRETIRRSAPDAELQVAVIEGPPTEVLLNISHQVGLVVVAGHDDSGRRESITRSVAGQLAVRTSAALCVVQSEPEPARHRIVVGHDGNSTDIAVRVAAEEAALRGSELLLVTTWHYPRDTRATSVDAAGLMEEGAAATQSAIVEEVRRTHPAVHVETTVQLGNAVDVLTELAESADLVVVGSHRSTGILNGGLRNGGLRHGGLRHGGLGRLVIGSVAVGLLHQRTCPVLVVPHD